MGVRSLLIDMHVLVPRSPLREESIDQGRRANSFQNCRYSHYGERVNSLANPLRKVEFFPHGTLRGTRKIETFLFGHAMTLVWSLANCRVPQIRETEWLGCGCYLTGMARGCTLLIEPVEYSEPWLAVERPGRRNLYFALEGEYHSLPAEPRNFGVWFIGVR